MKNQKARLCRQGITTLVGVVIIVAVAVIAFGGVFAYQFFVTQKINNQPQVQNQQQNQTDQTAGSAVQSQRATEDWETYTNTQYGFEFKYPKNWVIDDSGTGPTVNVWSSEEKKQEAKNAIIPIYPEFSVNYTDIASFMESVKGLALRDMSDVKDFVSSAFPNFAQINVGGKTAYAVIAVANRAVYTVYIELKNRVCVISTENSDLLNEPFDPKNPKISQSAKDILSTFKFTK